MIPRLAEQTLRLGKRLLVVSDDPAQLERTGKALWEHSPDSFLAHGPAGGPHDARQPILLSGDPKPGNGARFCALADGRWREGVEQRFARVFLLFGTATLDEARGCWRRLSLGCSTPSTGG